MQVSSVCERERGERETERLFVVEETQLFLKSTFFLKSQNGKYGVEDGLFESQ